MKIISNTLCRRKIFFLEEAEADGFENSPSAMKCKYLYTNDRCNSEEMFHKVSFV